MKALEYHEITKHHPNRFAKSLGYLDWENQPLPYKTYKAPILKLPKPTIKPLPYTALYSKNEFSPINIQNISALLRYSAAINAKKVYGPSSWYVRVNPSSGNLHPEEIYIFYKNSMYHFNPSVFALEEIAVSEEILVEDGILIALTSIPLRESWKYGERALRYSLLDLGHLIAAIRFSSNLLGWEVEFDDIDLGFLFERFEGEEEFFEAALKTKNAKININAIKNLNPIKEYKPLAKEKVKWDVIYKTITNLKMKKEFNFTNTPIHFKPSPFNAYEIIDNRRSALGFIPSFLSKEDFFDILDKTLQRNLPPFDVKITLNKVDFVIFVNRVDGIESGIYYFDRKNEKFSLIQKGDFSTASKFINCNQDLGKDSAFTINMVARIDDNEYKQSMIEAGMIGQVLYLEAEAKGIRGCGIGCFFDDLITKEILNDKSAIALCGFSIGAPLVDERIIKLD